MTGVVEIVVATYVLKSAMEVGEGALKDYLQGFFKGKLGDFVDKFQLERKAAMKKAIGEFEKLFGEELRKSGVSEKSINRYYNLSIESFIKDEDTIAILGEAFDRRFDNNSAQTRIKGIWIESHLKPGLTFPPDFDWELLLDEYRLKVKEIRRANEKLRKILDSETLESMEERLRRFDEKLQNSLNPDTRQEIYDGIQRIAPSPNYMLLSRECSLSGRLTRIGPSVQILIQIELNLDGYRESLQGSYGYLKLCRLESNDKHDIQLCRIFIEQNVREDLPPDRSQNPDSDESTQNRRQYLEKSAEPVLKVIRAENCQRAVLLGDPGSGKSSLLQYLALDWAEGKTERLSLLIELREYAFDRSGAKNFLDFLSGGARADWKFDRQELREYLLHKPSLVMFNGLDEIFDPQLRESIIDEIANFATQQYPKAKIVVTSRVVGYDPDRLRGVKFQHFTLQELDESQIHEFIDKWYELALGEDPQQEQLKRRIKDAIDRSPATRILANNPLLLTLMATLNQQESLPNRRVDLYDRASRLLLHNWDIEGQKLADPSLQAIEVSEKQEILGKIAYEMQSEAGLAGNMIGSQRLKQILKVHFKKEDEFQEWEEKAHRLIEQLRTRSFILCAYGADDYGFIHRTFLEYFCARDFVRRLKEEQYSWEQLRDDVFARYWQDETWHEVLQLICGLLEPEQAKCLVEFLITQEVERADYLDDEKLATTRAVHHLLLATECWAEVKSPKSGSTTEKLKEKLKKEIESESNIVLNYDAAKLLLDSIAKYYHTEPETITWLQQVALNDQCEDVRLIAVKSIVQYYHSIPDTLNCLQQVALNDQCEDVRLIAVKSIVQYYHSIPDTLNCLQQAALNDQDRQVRLIAIKSIVQYYHSIPETLNCLQQAALNDQCEDVRLIAIKSIVQYYHNVPETLNCLQQVALNDQGGWVREVAVKSIVQYYHSVPESLNCLQQVALNAQDRRVGLLAVESIAQDYHSVPESLNCLQQVALNAQDVWVRDLAVKSIVQYYHSVPDALNCLQQLMLNAQDGSVRWAAVKSIAQDYHSIPESLNCLQQVALNDQGGWVREVAVESIAQYYHGIPESLNCLQQVALNDQAKAVRKIAVKSIAQYYHTVPALLTWLQQVALNDQDEGSVRQVAIKSIAQYYHTVPALLTWLQQVAFNDQDMQVRLIAIKSIVQYYHNVPETLNCLQQLALNDQCEDVRQVAVKSIAQDYHSVPESLNCLQQIALNDQCEDVRRVAVESIVQYYHNVPETLNCLQQVALNDQCEDVRLIAIKSIVQYYHSVTETLNCLQQVALNDQCEDVRLIAIKSIVQYYHSVPDALNCLQQVALNGQDRQVRLIAVESIVQYYHNVPETLNCLQQVALNDQCEDVRLIAIKSIAEYYHTEPEILTWLQDIALQDRNELVRLIAIKSIVQYYHNNVPETLNCLQQVALNDQCEDVRLIAIKSIAEYYHTEPEILTWLQDIALQDRDDGVRFLAVCSTAQYYIQDNIAFKLLCQIASQDPYRGENDYDPRKIAL
jgi:HEAT repeat protein